MIMKKRNIFFILTVFSLFLWGCRYDFIVPDEVPVVDQEDPVSLATQVVPILAAKCTECHKTGGQTPDLTAANAYSQLVPKYVSTTSPATSKVYVFATSGAHYAKVSAAQGALILTWIQEGAKNN